MPLIRRCTDDRATNEDLQVQFTNTNEDLVAVDLTEGDVRLRLLPVLASGQAIIGVMVIDPAGNTWQDAFFWWSTQWTTPPWSLEFQSPIPVERELETVINMTWERC